MKQAIAVLFSSFLLQVEGFTLISFDVDGTLVRGSGSAADNSAHAQAFGHAVGKILGNGQPITPIAQALPRHKFHGSTDGLILLRLARATLGIEPTESASRLEEMMNCMYEYIAELDDSAVANGITPLPGVLENLRELATRKDEAICCLVTGNVEGIARRKMRAVGILETGALAPPSNEQIERSWPGSEEIGFLGGFGSDFCSGDIDDDARNHLDRSEQIAIAVRRAQSTTGKKLRRVVHVGDAPADVLAAKAFSEVADEDLVIGMVAVVTGSYSADLLRELAGEPNPGRWEPVILERGMDDPDFLRACGLS
jgi:phosphoglycolate phosphatase-like HAD superfamily hydrolase